MGIEIAHQGPQRAWARRCVRVQHEEVPCIRRAQRLVVRGTETNIPRVADQPHPREFVLHELRRAILTGVVYDDDLQVELFALCRERVQAAAEQVRVRKLTMETARS